MIERIPPVVGQPAPYAALFELNWLSASGTACLFAIIATALVLRVRPTRVAKIYIDTFKQLNTYLERQGLKANGPSMSIYTSTDDTGFSFQAAVPLADVPQNPPRGDIAVGKSPSGRALKFVHRGSYDSMDSTYEAITNHLDEKRLEAKDLFIEEYATDPVTTPEDQLVITVLVPIK